MYQVVLVDDESIILQGLLRVIPWGDFGCQVAGTASDGVEGVSLVRKVRPDILLTDIRMPNLNGLQMIAALKSEFPRMQITVLTAYRDFDYAHQALHLGVSRYLLKPSKMEELQEAIRHMTNTLKSLPPPAEMPEEAETAGEAAGSFVVKAAIHYMEEHYADHISLNQVADHVFVSQWHLSKLINRFQGQSFFDILYGIRIQRAKALLRDPSLKVHEISEQVGFADVAHFSKSFKKLVGKSPVEYRAGL